MARGPPPPLAGISDNEGVHTGSQPPQYSLHRLFEDTFKKMLPEERFPELVGEIPESHRAYVKDEMVKSIVSPCRMNLIFPHIATQIERLDGRTVETAKEMMQLIPAMNQQQIVVPQLYQQPPQTPLGRKERRAWKKRQKGR